MKIFKEEQRFRQTWLIVLISVSMIVPIIIISAEYFKENSSMSTNKFILIILFMVICICPFFFIKLKTRIDEIGIHYQFFPFHFSLKTIIWNDINSALVRKYDAISEYGGWGLKSCALWNKSKGKAINISGDIGIQLELKNGKKLLIGTIKEQEAKQVLETYKIK